MSRSRRKPGRNPELYPCKNPECDRTTPLALEGYEASVPNDVDPARVHRVVESDMPGFTLQCSQCGHYTVVARFPKQVTEAAKRVLDARLAPRRKERQTTTSTSGDNKAYSGIFSFPFRLYAAGALPEIEVRSSDGMHKLRIHPPLTVRSSGTPLSPDVPFEQWPGFRWHPKLPKNKRVSAPTGFNIRVPSNTFYDAIRVDCEGPNSWHAMYGFVPQFLAWLRRLTFQPWIGEFEPQTDSLLKYDFECDARGRAVDTPWAFGKSETAATWMRVVTDDIWREAAIRVARGKQPEAYWSLFLDSQLQRAVDKLDVAVLYLHLSIEVARDSNYPRFARAKQRSERGQVLEPPFADTKLLQHLGRRLQKEHGRSLERECPEEWQAVSKLHQARGDVAHGKAPLIQDAGVTRPATNDDAREWTDAVYRTLLWIEEL